MTTPTEREAHVTELRSAFIDITLHATKANKIANMLAADAQEIARLNAGWQAANVRALELQAELDGIRKQEPTAYRYKFKEDLQYQYTENKAQAHHLSVVECLYLAAGAQQVAVPQEPDYKHLYESCKREKAALIAHWERGETGALNKVTTQAAPQPPQAERVPMTYQQAIEMAAKWYCDGRSSISLIRDAEAHHGITGGAT